MRCVCIAMVLIACVVLVTFRGHAQGVSVFPIPVPEGKAFAVDLDRGSRLPTAFLAQSDTTMYIGMSTSWSRRFLYYSDVHAVGSNPTLTFLDTAYYESEFMAMVTEDRFAPCLARDAKGRGAVVWAKQRGFWDDIVYPETYGRPHVRCALLKDGTASRVMDIDSADHPTAVFDATGDLHVAYESVRCFPYQMYPLSWPETTFFFVTSRVVCVAIHPDGTRDSLCGIERAFRPRLLVDKVGNRHLFWLEADSSNSPAFILRYGRNPGTPGFSPSIIATNVRAGGRWNFNMKPPIYSAFVDGSGTAYAGWTDLTDYDSGTVSIAWSANGAQWHGASLTGLPLSGSPAAFHVSASGRVHVAWRTHTDSPGFWTLHVAQGGADTALFAHADTIPAVSSYPSDPIFVADSRDSVRLVFGDAEAGIGYCRDLIHPAAPILHVAAPSVMAWNIAGLPDGSRKVASAALDDIDQLWIAVTNGGSVSLVRLDATATSAGHAAGVPSGAFGISQNYPNPFNPSTRIRVEVGERSWTDVRVFDVVGREVATLLHGVMDPGTYELTFDASGLSTGVYVCRMASGGRVASRKLIVVR